MIVVFAPEPCTWLDPLFEELKEISPLTIWAPWAGRRPAFLRRRSAFFRRRELPEGRGLPGWIAVEALARVWERGRTDRRLAWFFASRGLLDFILAPRLPTNCTLVVAPSGAARRLFSRARAQGTQTLLVQDVPLLREFHGDLDRALDRHPACTFLGRYRASHSVVARQEAEWVLSDGHLHFSSWASERLCGNRTCLLMPPITPNLPPAQAGCAEDAHILLAGKACGRTGIMEALEALESRPRWTLLIQAGEGLEPEGVLSHPQVKPYLEGDRVSAVIAPAWAELNAPEVLWAATNSIPVVATSKARGLLDLKSYGVEIEPGDAAALRDALDHLLGGNALPAIDLEAVRRSARERLVRWVLNCVLRG